MHKWFTNPSHTPGANATDQYNIWNMGKNTHVSAQALSPQEQAMQRAFVQALKLLTEAFFTYSIKSESLLIRNPLYSLSNWLGEVGNLHISKISPFGLHYFVN